MGGSRGLENLIVFPHGGIAEVRAHVHTMFCDLAAEAIMALESWVLSATPEVVSLLTPLDLLDVATTAAAAAPAPAATTYDEPFEAVSENESNITARRARALRDECGAKQAGWRHVLASCCSGRSGMCHPSGAPPWSRD